jgi:succinate dehydrogenase/fumarate reductase flavoprotein subunit
MTADAFDVVVLGTGAAGLVAAATAAHEGASVGLFEKSDMVGGTTAMSGGIIWMPNNHLQEAAGVVDSRQMALEYLDSLSLGQIDSDMAAAFVDQGPEAVRWVEEHTPCQFHIVEGYPDYHPEHPGGLPGGGRSLDNALFPFPELGAWAAKVRNQRGVHPVTLTDTPLGGATAMPAPEVLAQRIEAGLFGMGLGLTGALLKACLDRGVEPVLEARATRVLMDGDRVTGVRFTTPRGEREVRAGAVIVATGGFEWNEEMVRTFLRGPMTAPAGSPANTGDGVQMALDAGARLGNMRNAWWVPVVRVPGEQAWGAPSVRLILLERTRPRTLMVNREGRRFTNEAGNYNAMGGAFHAFDPSRFTYPNQPCWLIFDHGHKMRYDVAGCPAGDRVPDWMHVGDTPEDLAVRLGMQPATLAATIARFNEFAARGEDPDFGRGVSAYDTFNGDRSLPGVQATLGALDRGPYYAIELESGALGTNGGPATDTRGRVIARHGGVISGLYAAGNVMAAPTGMVYGGAGGTLGPAITFGWIAGRDAATLVTLSAASPPTAAPATSAAGPANGR